MAFTVIKSIGTSSRVYSTLASWEAGAPADLTATPKYTCATFDGTFFQDETVTGNSSGAHGQMCDSDGATYMVIRDITGSFTNGETLTGGSSGFTCVITTPAASTGIVWRGEAYNDSEFTGMCSLSGSTSSATCYKLLTVAAGQGAFRRTDPLVYDQTKGVACAITGVYQQSDHSEAYSGFSGFQVRVDFASSFILYANPTNVFAEGDGGPPFHSPSTCINTVIFLNTGGGDGVPLGNATFIGCLIIRTADVSPAGQALGTGNYSTQIAHSTGFFGFTSMDDGSHHLASGSSNNATDLSSIGAGTSNQVNVPYSETTPLTEAGRASTDLRPVAATALDGNGYLDSTNAPNDITGFVRANPPTIGPWELAGVAGAVVPMMGQISI